MKNFNGKVAIVTGGGGSGIGHCLVKALAKNGAKVAYCDIANLASTEEAIAEYGVESYNEIVDIGNKQAISTFVDNVLAKFGQIDILINNAGIALGELTFEQVTEADFEKITNINYWGVVHTTMRCYPHMLKQKEAAIVNLSSAQGILSLPYLVPYCTTKFAVRGFTDTLRLENKIRGINNISLHTVHPGRVATNITLNADYVGKGSEKFHADLQKGTSPEDAAEIILKGIRKKTGRIFISDGRLHDVLARVLPTHADKVVKQIMKFKKIDII